MLTSVWGNSEVIKPDTLLSHYQSCFEPCVWIDDPLPYWMSTMESRKAHSSQMQETKVLLGYSTLSVSPFFHLSALNVESVCDLRIAYNPAMWLTKESEEKKARAMMGGWDAEQRGWKVDEWQVLLWPKCRSLQQQGQRSKWSWKVNLNSQEAHPVRDADKGGGGVRESDRP